MGIEISIQDMFDLTSLRYVACQDRRVNEKVLSWFEKNGIVVTKEFLCDPYAAVAADAQALRGKSLYVPLDTLEEAVSEMGDALSLECGRTGAMGLFSKVRQDLYVTLKRMQMLQYVKAVWIETPALNRGFISPMLAHNTDLIIQAPPRQQRSTCPPEFLSALIIDGEKVDLAVHKQYFVYDFRPVMGIFGAHAEQFLRNGADIRGLHTDRPTLAFLFGKISIYVEPTENNKFVVKAETDISFPPAPPVIKDKIWDTVNLILDYVFSREQANLQAERQKIVLKEVSLGKIAAYTKTLFS